MFNPYVESVLIFLGINAVLALSLYVPASAGLLSLGQGGFMAIGAYTSAVITTSTGWPFSLALLIGMLAAGAAGGLVGFPALRIRGVYLIILTMGFGEIVRIFFLNFEPTGGASGLGGIAPRTTLAGVAGATALLLAFCVQIRRTRIGRALEAVRQDEGAAQVTGVNLTATKVGAFAWGAAFAGLGGGLYAHHALFIDAGQFGFFRSAEIFITLLLGGMGSHWGALVGAVVVTVLPELLRFLQDWRMTFFGSLLVLMMILRPWGLVGVKQRHFG